jgi:CheY-like chemotaxis protein
MWLKEVGLLMHTHKVFIVEDDADIRESLAEVVESLGFEVALAENGKDALQKLSESSLPCLILVDWMMPIMDGLAFLRAKELLPRISAVPAIVLTANPLKARNATNARIIPKPLDIHELADAVSDICKAA